LAPQAANRDGEQSADSVEKVGPSRLPAYWLLKTPFLRAATRNLCPQSSAQSKDFNLKRILFCRGNHDRLFQQNRPEAGIRINIALSLIADSNKSRQA
jgi:hypothetical protein